MLDCCKSQTTSRMFLCREISNSKISFVKKSSSNLMNDGSLGCSDTNPIKIVILELNSKIYSRLHHMSIP